MFGRESALAKCLWTLLVLVPITLSIKQLSVQAFGEVSTVPNSDSVETLAGVCTNDGAAFSGEEFAFEERASGIILQEKPGGMSDQALETIQSWTLDIQDKELQGITFDILQNVKTFIEFSTLPGQNIEVKLLSKGQNSALDGAPPAIDLQVAALESGPAVHVRVGDYNAGYSPVWLGVLSLTSLVLLAAAVKFWNSANLKNRQETDVKDGVCAENTLDVLLTEDKNLAAKEEDENKQEKSLTTAGEEVEKKQRKISRQDEGLLCRGCSHVKSSKSFENNRAKTRVQGGHCKKCGHPANTCGVASLPSSLTHGQEADESVQRRRAMKPVEDQPLPEHDASTASSRPCSRRHIVMTSPLLSSSRPHLYLRRLFLLSLSLAALTAVAVGVSSMKKEYTLQIGVPSDKLIRKVRMYAENPELDKLSRSLRSSLNLVSRLQLLDLENCHGNLSECETVAVCDGGGNDLICRCRRGYYFQDQQCKECSKSCPDGQYLVTPCSADSDTICKPCTACTESQYEAAACTTTRDTICVDVTFPVGILPMNSSMLQDDGTEIAVTHSSNIFMERLIKMKELETPMYITNNQQSMDFVWRRKSGMNIIISVSGVYLLPEYRELDVADDSVFFQQKLRLTESQRAVNLFAETREKYCKHPVPDYYDLILQVTRNRTSAAEVVMCDSQDTSVPRCPDGYKDGDRFLKWNINAKCEKYAHIGGANMTLTPLQGRINEVVCTDETPLDTKVFRMPRPATLEMMFPSAECSLYQQDCNACLVSAKCSPDSSDHHSCCGLACYNQQACVQAFSPACPPTKVECASGEVRTFILQPVFSQMEEKFDCYLQYKAPDYLYNVSYSLHIESLGFTVPLQNYTASVRSITQHQRSDDTFDFIQLWHDTRMPITEELILSGNHRELQQNGEIHMKPFTVHPLKQHDEFSRGGFLVKNDGGLVYRTAVQFERPFLYSSTSWNRGGCGKNVSQIFPNQTTYKREGTRVLARKQQDDFVYQMYRADRSPYIKFSVPDGTSVLRWFQGRTAHGTIIGEELSGQLSWDAKQQNWTITVSGAVKNCPAIFTMQVFNKLMSSCVGIYDVLVACPSRFNLTLSMQRSQSDLADIFVVFLNDSQASHRMVLSSIIAPVEVTSASLQGASYSAASADSRLEAWTPVFAVVILFMLGVFVVFVVYLKIKFQSMKAATEAGPVVNQAETPALNNQSNSSMAQKPAESKPKTSQSARTCMCVFIILYILYSIIFTFSVVLVILYFTHLSLMGNVNGITDFSSQLQKELNASFMRVQDHERQEEIRLYKSVESRLQACAHHLQDQNREFLHSYQHSVNQLLLQVFQKDGTIESLTGQSILQNSSVYSQEIQQFLVDCNRTVQSILDRFQSHFAVYSRDVMQNSWLDFPREIFLEQEGDSPHRKYMSANQLVRFLHWLKVDKTDELLHVADTVAAGLSSIKLPSPEDYLKQTVDLPADDFASSLPPEPMVASHTFLVLDRPEAGSDVPHFYTDPSSSTSGPKPKAAFYYSGRASDDMKFDDGEMGQIAGLKAEDVNNSANVTGSSEESESGNLFMYILIGLFLLIDVLMFIYRMSWMVMQVRAAREGYEDRIPTDIVSQKILAIQSGYHVGRMQDLYEPYSYQMENKENIITAEERASESEFNVYFCQSYPKSKDDILREIMAQKMSSQEKGLSGEEQVGVPHNQQRLKKLGVIQECASCCRWLHRVLISHLVWRFVLTAILILFLCLLVYAADFWLTADNLRILVGGQSAANDLQLQIHMTNHHLARLADHLSTVLDEHRSAVEAEITVSTVFLSSTLNTQRELLLTMLESVCQGTSTAACSSSLHSFLPVTSQPSWQACNFLPVQPHLYQDLSTEHLDHMVAQQLSPLLDAFKSCLFSLSAILMAVLCVMFLCHASATVARYYMLIWGRLPRVPIYQISENTSLLYDGGPGTGKPMQRSASWLESCESGVYVGESEDTNTNRDV